MSMIPREDIDRAIDWIAKHKATMFRLVDRAVTRSTEYIDASRPDHLKVRIPKTDNHLMSELVRYWILQEIVNDSSLGLALDEMRVVLKSPIKNSIRFSFDGFNVKINALPRSEPRNPTAGVVAFMTQSHYDKQGQEYLFDELQVPVPQCNPNIAIRYRLTPSKRGLAELVFIVPDGWDKDGKLIKLHDKGVSIEEIVAEGFYPAAQATESIRQASAHEGDLPLVEEKETQLAADDKDAER